MGAADHPNPLAHPPTPVEHSGQNRNGSNSDLVRDTCLPVGSPEDKKSALEAAFSPAVYNQEEIVLPEKDVPPPEAPTDLKSSIPQILACTAVSSFNFAEGMSLAYSSSLVPQLLQADSDVKITFEQGITLGSMMVLAMAAGAPTGGVIMNRFGRVNGVRICNIPYALGWILTAVSSSYEMILVGRLLIGFAITMGISTACVYNTEVANPKIRGALNAACPAVASLGCLVTYVLGAYTHWRTHAWICVAAPIVTVIAMQKFAYESPIWLASKGRMKEAEKSLRALARSNTTQEAREDLPARQLAWLIQRQKAAQSASQKTIPWYYSVLDIFRKPIGYKPLIIMALIFAVQQFAGCYITLFFAATFFKKMGSSMEYTAAIWIGVVRFFFGIVGVAAIRYFGVRRMMIFSSLGMAVCMAGSGYLTVDNSLGLGEWAPTSLVLTYVAFSCCGLLLIPWAMTAEVYSDRLRDAGNALTMNIALLLMFLGLQLYPILESSLGGSGQLQFFFAAVSLGSVVLSFLILPETSGLTLHEIEQHYKHNFFWLGRRKAEKEKPCAPAVDVAVLSA